MISLLNGVGESIGAEIGLSMEPPHRLMEEEAAHRRNRNTRDAGGMGRINGRGGITVGNDRKNGEDDDSNVSTSASESSHLGEYEESDE